MDFPLGQPLSIAFSNGRTLGFGYNSYASGSHRLSLVGAQNVAYDAAGNTIGLPGGATLAYSDANRLAALNAAGVPGQTQAYYRYAFDGERAGKAASTAPAEPVPTVFLGSTSGLLEEQTTGLPPIDYLYADGLPVAVVEAGQLYLLESGGLGEPRKAVMPGSTSATDTVVWNWDVFGPAFGNTQPTVTPPSAFALNLRFPGQYYDQETGLAHNGYRDYDAQTGRYAQSDPVGLGAGPDTYTYVNGNPVSNVDPLGLEQWRGCWDGSVAPYGACPPIPPVRPNFNVLLCHRPADLIPPLNMFDHYWMKTKNYESGMGGNCPVPGQGCMDWPYSATVTKDHTGQSLQPNAICVEIPINAQCVDQHIKPGQPTGSFSPWNNCQTFSNSVIRQCTMGPPR